MTEILTGYGVAGSTITAFGSGTGVFLDVHVDRVGATTVGSESYLYGVSGGDWYPLAVVSGGEGILRTSTSVDSVFVASGNVYIQSGATLSVTETAPVKDIHIVSGTVTTVSDVTSAFIKSGTITSVTSAFIKSGTITAVTDITNTIGADVYIVSGATVPTDTYIVSGATIPVDAYLVSGATIPVSGQTIQTYPNIEMIRLTTGSPPTLFKFATACKAVMVDNLGDGKVFVGFDTTADVGSVFPIVNPLSTRSFDLACGSVSVLASGTDTPEVQVFGLR